MPENHFLLIALLNYLVEELLRDRRSSELAVKRVSQMLAFTIQRNNGDIWETLVDVDGLFKFITVGEKYCRTLKATSLIFIKDISVLMEAALKEWWPKKCFLRCRRSSTTTMG